MDTVKSLSVLSSVREGNLTEITLFLQNGTNVNSKDNDGKSLLHLAAYNGHTDIVCLLLENGADPTQVTEKGNTPLHIATCKGYREIVEVLLQHKKLNNFINAKTTTCGTTALHVAAKNGFLEIVESLLKHGAAHDVKNKEGKTALNLATDMKVIKLLNVVQELFDCARDGDLGIIGKLKTAKPEVFTASTLARNNEGRTLLQIAIVNDQKLIVNNLLAMMKDGLSSTICDIDVLEKLKQLSEKHLNHSDKYHHMLQDICSSDNPQKCHIRMTYTEINQIIQNVSNLIQVYRIYVPGSVDCKSIQTVNATMIDLEFDLKYFPLFYPLHEGSFSFKGPDRKRYEFLLPLSCNDVKPFIKLVECNIDAPIKRFLESIKRRLSAVYSEKLFCAIKNNDSLGVWEYANAAAVNLKDSCGKTSLHHAVNNGDTNIVDTLLNNGADATQMANDGLTALHIASSKGHRDVVNLLLQNASHELNVFIDVKITSSGFTSLHIAAKNGFLEIVKSLLKNGATYDIENNEGKTPRDLATDLKVTKLLKLVEEVFVDARNGNLEIISKLKTVVSEEFIAVTKACNSEGNTVLQVAIVNKHKIIVTMLLEMMEYRDVLPSLSSTTCEEGVLYGLKGVCNKHLHFSDIYLNMLQDLSSLNGSEENPFPWKTLKEGSYYLSNANHVVEAYKNCTHGLVANKSIHTVNEMLKALEFDPEHISSGYTDEAYGGKAQCFVSKGQRYTLLQFIA